MLAIKSGVNLAAKLQRIGKCQRGKSGTKFSAQNQRVGKCQRQNLVQNFRRKFSGSEIVSVKIRCKTFDANSAGRKMPASKSGAKLSAKLQRAGNASGKIWRKFSGLENASGKIRRKIFGETSAGWKMPASKSGANFKSCSCQQRRTCQEFLYRAPCRAC